MDVPSYDKRLARHQQLIGLKIHDFKSVKTSCEIAYIFSVLGSVIAFTAFLQGAGLSVFIPAVLGLFVTAAWRSSVHRKFLTLEKHKLKAKRVRARLENHATIMHDLAIARATFLALNKSAPARHKNRRKTQQVALFENIRPQKAISGSSAIAFKKENALARPRKSKSIRRMKRTEVASLLDHLHPNANDFGSGLPA